MMRAVQIGILALVFLASGLPEASAQSGYVTTETPPVSVQPMPALPSAPPTPNLDYEEFQLQQLRGKARRSRNALIGLSAASVVGAALFAPGVATQCSEVLPNSGNDYQNWDCSPGGWALVSIGGTLLWGGLTGVLITGIMFGVRQGKIRRLEDSIAFKKSRALQWDPASGRFVF